MRSQEEIWEGLVSDYMRKIECALARSDHPRKDEVLQDVRDHLEQRFTELKPDQRTPRRLKGLIEEMGGPEEYVELLAPDQPARFWRLNLARHRWLAPLALGVVIASLVTCFVLTPLKTLVGLNILLYLGIAIALVVKYRRTRDNGLIWLGVALLIWPLAATPLVYGERHLFDRIIAGEKIGLYPFSLVGEGQITAGNLAVMLGLFHRLTRWGLVLVAFIKLYGGSATVASAGGRERRYGGVALGVSLGGLVVAFAIGMIASVLGYQSGMPAYLVFAGCQAAAFVLGLISWKEPFGKASCITSALLAVGSIAFVS